MSLLTKAIKEQEKYESLEKDVTLLRTLFVDLDHIITNQHGQLDSLENHIVSAKEEILTAQRDIVVANQIAHTGPLGTVTNLTAGMVGAGIGAIVYLYNPYLAIGSILIGGYTGWSISDAVLSHQALE